MAYHHDIAEILLNVALITIKQTTKQTSTIQIGYASYRVVYNVRLKQNRQVLSLSTQLPPFYIHSKQSS